jgi:hypothetical protein
MSDSHRSCQKDPLRKKTEGSTFAAVENSKTKEHTYPRPCQTRTRTQLFTGLLLSFTASLANRGKQRAHAKEKKKTED